MDSHGNSQADVSSVHEDFWIRGLDDKEGYYYQGPYADCVRAVDFLASRPEIDRGRIAVYRRLPVPKEYRVYPEAGHWVEAAHARERQRWMLDYHPLKDAKDPDKGDSHRRSLLHGL